MTLLLVYTAYKHLNKKHKLTILSVYIYISVFHPYFHRITRYHSVPARSFAPHGVGLAALHSRPAAWPREQRDVSDAASDVSRTCRGRVEGWGAGRPHQGRWQRLTLSVSDAAHSDHSVRVEYMEDPFGKTMKNLKVYQYDSI